MQDGEKEGYAGRLSVLYAEAFLNFRHEAGNLLLVVFGTGLQGLAYDLGLTDGEVGCLRIDGPVVGRGILEIVERDLQLPVILHSDNEGTGSHVTQTLAVSVEHDEDNPDESHAFVDNQQQPPQEELSDAGL